MASATALANRLVERVGPRPLAAAGLAIAAAGMARLGHAPLAADYWTDVLPAMIILGLGAGLSFVSITTAALGRVDDAAAGLASGMLSTSVQVGGAIGVAVLAGAVVVQRSGDLIASGTNAAAAELGGLQLAFLLAGAASLAASLIAMRALERSKPTAPDLAALGKAAA